MAKINETINKFHRLYTAGFFILLALPVLIIRPYIFPADWSKTVIFRSILAIMIFSFLWMFLYKKNELSLPEIKKNVIIWALAGIFAVFFLASIFSVDPYFSFWGSPYRGGGFITFAFYFPFAILTFILLNEKDWKKTWIFSIFIGVLVSLVAIIQYYGLFSEIFTYVPNGPPSTMGNPILLGIYLLLLFFPTLSFTINEDNPNIKKFYIFSLTIFAFAILISGTRASYLGILIGALYFILLYPKKLKLLKTCLSALLIIVFSAVLYTNIAPHFPQILQKNRIFQTLENRLSVKKALNDERYRAWQTVIKEIQDKPLLGWGPENLSVGFDKNYSSEVTPSPWWDKAHNMFLQIGAEAGILGIIAYILLFIALFRLLQKNKKADGLNEEKAGHAIAIHGIQAALISYLAANFFSFDSFGTYFVFFLLIGYSMNIIYGHPQGNKPGFAQKKTVLKSVLMPVLLITLVIFLWQYNLAPLGINADINKAEDLAGKGQCDQTLSLMDNVVTQRSFLDSYASIEYVQFEKTCAVFRPENTLTYAKKGIDVLSNGAKVQPRYTRYWIWLGDLTTTLAEQDNNLTAESPLVKQANFYFDKALQLAPNHQEILTGKAKIEMDAGDYNGAKAYSEKCIALNPATGDCYWYLGLTEIYLKDSAAANKNMQLAETKGYNVNSAISLAELGNVYGDARILDYQNLAIVFEKLTKIRPENAQYHSTLAFIYSKLGEYDNARQEAEISLKLSPQSKDSINAFLNNLPK